MRHASHLRQAWAFIYRDYQLTRRYWSWVVVFTVYALVNSATVTLIGVAAQDTKLTLTLAIGVLLWSFLSVLFSEISQSIAYERWEGTLEYTFMAPVSRFVHLLGVSLYAALYSMVRMICVLLGLWLFVDLNLAGGNLGGVFVVLLISSFAFVGLGIMAAVLPVMSPERGAEATNILQALVLLVSGIYYPIDILPGWLQPFSALSPATYALSASRKLLGIETLVEGQPLAGAPLTAVLPEIGVLAAMGAVSIPLGLWLFAAVERWAKHTGKLKRTG